MSRLSDVLLQGTHAARPAAAAGNTAYLYFETDTQVLVQSNGTSWVQIAAAGASGVGAVANAGSAPSLQVGTDASKPAAGTAGRLYVATDTLEIYEDSGTAWVEVATAALGKLTGYDSTEAATNDTLGSSSTVINNLNRIRYQLAQLGTGAWTTLRAMVQLSPGSQQSGTINVSGEVQGADFKPSGLTGATAATRYVGGTTTSHPSAGTFAVGDYVVTQDASVWVCTIAGTPGTWTQIAGGGGGGSSTLAGDTDVAISSPVGGQVLGYNGSTAKWVNQNVASGSVVSTGVAGSEPSAPNSGDLYVPNNAPYIERYSSTAWVPWGPILPLTAPPAVGTLSTTQFGWVNQGSATVSSTGSTQRLACASQGASDSYRMLLKTLSSATPYTLTACIALDLPPTNYVSAGLVLRQSSTGNLVVFIINYSSGYSLVFGKVTSAYSGSPGSYKQTSDRRLNFPWLWLRIQDDGTNRMASVSSDGINFQQFSSSGRTDYMTPDQAGVFVNPDGDAAGLTLLSWNETNP